MFNINTLATVIVAGIMIAGASPSIVQSQTTGEIVTPENYSFAEVDITFKSIVDEVGSNIFRHDRSLMPLDKQPAVTMNRNTVYSFGIFYAPKGTTVTLPETKDDRYMSAMIMQNDHYIDQVFYGAGTYEIIAETEFSGIAIRTQVDESVAGDIEYVNTLQDQIFVTLPDGVTAKEYVPKTWDAESLNSLRALYQEEAKSLESLSATSGARGTIDPHMQRLGVSVALGLLPPEDAVYFYRDYGLNGQDCFEATYTAPEFEEKGSRRSRAATSSPCFASTARKLSSMTRPGSPTTS